MGSVIELGEVTLVGLHLYARADAEEMTRKAIALVGGVEHDGISGAPNATESPSAAPGHGIVRLVHDNFEPHLRVLTPRLQEPLIETPVRIHPCRKEAGGKVDDDLFEPGQSIQG